jgi:CubicO group peptidase (beta-lactamase class C family)
VTLGLVDENRVSLDDPVSRFVPDWPRADEITVRMLVSGSSGIAAFGEPLPDLQARIAADPSRDWSASDALTIARSREPRFDPGTRVSPTDTDDALLAEIIASVTGDTASAEIRRRLLEPLGLDATFAAGEPVPPAGSSSSPGAPRTNPEMIRGHAVGASPGSFEQVDDVSAELLAVLGPARGMAATVGDVARWSDLLRRDRAVLSPESRGLVSLPYEAGGAGGAATCPCLDGAPRAVVIEGRSGAYSALVAWFPDRGATIAILVDREVARADIQTLLEQVDRLVPK